MKPKDASLITLAAWYTRTAKLSKHSVELHWSPGNARNYYNSRIFRYGDSQITLEFLLGFRMYQSGRGLWFRWGYDLEIDALSSILSVLYDESITRVYSWGTQGGTGLYPAMVLSHIAAQVGESLRDPMSCFVHHSIPLSQILPVLTGVKAVVDARCRSTRSPTPSHILSY